MSLHRARLAAAVTITASTLGGCHSGPYYAGSPAADRGVVAVGDCGPCGSSAIEILPDPRPLAMGSPPPIHLSPPIAATGTGNWRGGQPFQPSGVHAASLSSRLHDNFVSRKIAEHKERQAAPPHPRFHPVPVRPVFYPANDAAPAVLGQF